ncbi:putative restriction endonuclease [Campylobacter iguaniorum]|uniref:restriction endonuclease n=1 Tax=Campylobacter iguaniorum TaxID=1244531 RepID=UPI0007C9531A|nr:restriction endonuclease [Campylobacter iguaniorum]ANE35831.1 putative restriction endonuclease [Campylobacter iguaniorum]
MIEYIIPFGAGSILTSGYLYIQMKKVIKQREQEKLEKEKYLAKLKQINIEKGKKYELQISKYFKNLGYKVYENGVIKGKSDGGIDLIAHKEKETILIQCKNHNKPLKQDIIRKFIGDCHMYEKENKQYLKNRMIKKIIISNSNMDIGMEFYIKQHELECEFMQIKAE